MYHVNSISSQAEGNADVLFYLYGIYYTNKCLNMIWLFDMMVAWHVQAHNIGY